MVPLRLAIVLCLVALTIGAVPGCYSRELSNLPDVHVGDAPLSAAKIANIETFCSACHRLPDPQTYPKSHWEEEVEQGFQFYIASNRTDLVEPTRSDTVRYFRNAAPESIAIPAVSSVFAKHKFRRIEPVAASGTLASSVSHLRWDAKHKSLLLSDMRSGEVSTYLPGDGWRRHVLGKVGNSCRVTPSDWNGDGTTDYLICDLGSFPVGDHTLGRLELWLADGSAFRVVQLADQLGRVVEAQPIDYDEDGDLDILLADFGWRTTGALKLLRNPGGDADSQLRMNVEVLDTRHGALGVQVADLNNDLRNDYVVAYGQEYESLEVYYNEGGGEFEKKTILELPDPSYNASSFTLADIDADGQLDIVHTNGDTMDGFLPKPFHGVRWLRNAGEQEWEVRELGLLVGALQACVADFDGDSDLDIAAVGMLPITEESSSQALDSVVWWEQDAELTFRRHALEQYGTSHATCTAGDVNRDGLPDLIVGQWTTAAAPPIEVFLSVARDD